jgi:hypothetical protein
MLRIISQIPVKEYYPDILDGTNPYADYSRQEEMRWHWEREAPFPPLKGGSIIDCELTFAEIEPVVRRIRWFTETKVHTYSLQFPYLQLMYCEGWLGMGIRREPWKPPLSLYAAPFPNIYASGRVCQTQAKNLEDAVATFFGSYFELPMDWSNCRDFAILAGIYDDQKGFLTNSRKLFEYWEANPDFILDFDWSKMGKVGKYESGTAISFLYNLQTGIFD